MLCPFSREIGGGLLDREREGEQGPAVLRVELDPPVHQLCQLTRDRQAEPAARRAPALEPVEPLEDVLAYVRRDRGPVVGDGERRASPVERSRDADGRSLGGVPKGG